MLNSFLDQSDRATRIRSALLRTVAFFDVMDYAPTWSECSSWIEWDGEMGFERLAPPSALEILDARDDLVRGRLLEEGLGRIALAGRLERLSAVAFERIPLFARKLRRAKRVAKWLSRFSSVRFVALVNTASLASSRDAGDLDFFVIVRHEHMWLTRLFSVFPYRFLGKLSKDGAKPDAVCLSYFISDQDVRLSSHMLKPDDPYFRYWFLSMLPLYNDGISSELWRHNSELLSLHPRAQEWISAPSISIRSPRFRVPRLQKLESLSRKIQTAWFPRRIREMMNLDTSVIVSDSVLKFHVDDRRALYRQAYLDRLTYLGIS